MKMQKMEGTLLAVFKKNFWSVWQIYPCAFAKIKSTTPYEKPKTAICPPSHILNSSCNGSIMWLPIRLWISQKKPSNMTWTTAHKCFTSRILTMGNDGNKMLKLKKLNWSNTRNKFRSHRLLGSKIVFFLYRAEKTTPKNFSFIRKYEMR